MDFDDLREEAATQPVVVSLPPLAEFYLDELTIYSSVKGFERDLYNPDHRFENDVVIDSDEDVVDYPQVTVDQSPFSADLNTVVDWADRNCFNRVKEQLLCQSSISDRIVRRNSAADAVALVIIDGLSFESIQERESDLIGDSTIEPAFVDGVSITPRGFRRVIYGGEFQSINARLNMKSFTDHIGFTYWSKGQEDLSTDLYRSMHEDKIHRIREFDQVCSTIRDHGLDSKTYIQITRMGLDQESHNRKEQPAIDHLVGEIISDVNQMYEVLDELSDHFRIYLTSDHGILWRGDVADDMQLIDEDHSHPRYIEGATKISKGITERVSSETQRTALAYPYMTRDFQHTEWGVHGGLSYQESFVPFIEITSS